MSKHGPYLTRNRRRPFSKCSHTGFGVYCHRCKQADGMAELANQLLKVAQQLPKELTVESTTNWPKELKFDGNKLTLKCEHISMVSVEKTLAKTIRDWSARLLAESSRLKTKPVTDL